MSRALTALLAAGAMLAGVQAASAQYYGPVDYYDAPPPSYYDAPPRSYYEQGYERYDRPRYYDERTYYGEPRYDAPPRPYYPQRRYRDRPRYDDDPGYGAYYPPAYRGYRDDDAEDALIPPDAEGPDEERERGFDPRRPHLGDGTDAPAEQYYPRRPRSCGEYYYWDGQACVDARKYPPYVGPKL